MVTLHLATYTHNHKIQEYFNDFADPYVKQAGIGMPEVVDSYFKMPDNSGLGIEVDEDVIRAHPIQDAHFNLFEDEWHKRD